jgi:hypothetical protein
MQLILQILIRIHFSEWDLAAKMAVLQVQICHTYHTSNTDIYHTSHTNHTNNTRGPPAFDLSKSDRFPRRGGGEGKETLLLVPHAECFTEPESVRIGRRTQTCVIRGLLSGYLHPAGLREFLIAQRITYDMAISH